MELVVLTCAAATIVSIDHALTLGEEAPDEVDEYLGEVEPEWAELAVSCEVWLGLSTIYCPGTVALFPRLADSRAETAGMVIVRASEGEGRRQRSGDEVTRALSRESSTVNDERP